MASFLSIAGRQTKDIRQFLREAADGNTIKYKAIKGGKHQIYFPFEMVPEVDSEGNQTVVKSMKALSFKIHEWVDREGKYRSTVCTSGIVRNNGDVLLNDGSCPICDSINKGWEIYNYRIEEETKNCGKTGTELEEHLKNMRSSFLNERKARESKSYLYVLVVVFRFDPKTGAPIIGQNSLPEFDLKVMKLSASRVEKIQTQVENAGAELIGGEVIFDYPNEDDIRYVVGHSTTAPVFETKMLTRQYKGLIDAIQVQVDKFEWEGLEKSFPELTGMTTTEMDKTIKELFTDWDEYQKELKVNPNAKYLEYVGVKSDTQPALGQVDVPPAVTGPTPSVPGVAPVGVAPGVAGIPDANELFGGTASAPKVDGIQL